MDNFFAEDAVIQKYADLLKEATSLKRENISKAVTLIKQALKILNGYSLSFRRDGIKKLSDYERLNSNHLGAIQILHEAYEESLTSDDFFMRIMEAGIFIAYMHYQLKRMKIKLVGLENEADKLHIVALSIQGRMDEISSRVPRTCNNFELKEYLMNNHAALSYFHNTSKTKNIEYAWKNDEQMHHFYKPIIHEITQKIEQILLTTYSSIKEELDGL